MNIRLNRSHQKFLFILLITAVYTVLVIQFEFLQEAKVKDEPRFWETILMFSDSLIPSVADLRNYQELNTPLPFIMFGMVEYLFNLDIFGARLFNLILSLIIAFIIGWPNRNKKESGILCTIGLLVCPYFLICGGRLYTDIIACFWVLLGFMAYIRDRHWLSSLAFILAIASRQYMLAFPAAIATYELIIALNHFRTSRKFDLSAQWRWIAPAIAAGTIFGWIYFFQGLAPSGAIDTLAPKIQQDTWLLKPNRIVYFLSFISIYMVIPEFFLFQPIAKIKSIKGYLKQRWRRVVIIAGGLLLFCLVFPPILDSDGMFAGVVKLLRYEILQSTLFYVLALFACLRFFHPNLMFFCVAFNCIILMKAHYWSKYVLPLSIVFWYLKSLGLEDHFNLSGIMSNPPTKANKRKLSRVRREPS